MKLYILILLLLNTAEIKSQRIWNLSFEYGAYIPLRINKLSKRFNSFDTKYIFNTGRSLGLNLSIGKFVFSTSVQTQTDYMKIIGFEYLGFKNYSYILYYPKGLYIPIYLAYSVINKRNFQLNSGFGYRYGGGVFWDIHPRVYVDLVGFRSDGSKKILTNHIFYDKMPSYRLGAAALFWDKRKQYALTLFSSIDYERKIKTPYGVQPRGYDFSLLESKQFYIYSGVSLRIKIL